MSDLRPDLPHAAESGHGVRDAKIEELLLVGLDHYFAGQYEQAIHVWTRVLFLDRGHTRARAYIERARSAIAERQRELEELLQAGVAAFERGDVDQARQLVGTSIAQGGPSDLAIALMSRLDRHEAAGTERPEDAELPQASRIAATAGTATRTPPIWRVGVLIAAISIAAGAVGLVFARGIFQPAAAPRTPRPIAVVRPEPLRLPRAAEAALARSRALFARGRLYDALAELDRIGIADPLRPDADRLQADIQRALIETATLPPPR